MNPPSEQLIRDYLNRMSVAARARLGFRDRQALLDRTRMRIEIACGGPSAGSDARVRKVLAGLGDPVAMVECEHARIAAGSEPLAGPESGDGDRAKASAARVKQFLDVHLRAGRPASDRADDADDRPVPGSALVPRPAVSPESAGRGYYAAPAAGEEFRPGRDREPAKGSEPAPDQNGLPGLDRTQHPIPVGSSAAGSATRGRVGGAAALAIGRLWRLADGAAVLARRNPLEAIALVLMAAGGAAFPPVWLAGAAVALASKTWGLRDKWTGLAVPVLLVICGAVIALIVGGKHASLGSYAFEAWLAAGRVSRGAAVLGAGYLLWGLYRGPRAPKQPPWNVPRRRG